MRDLNCVFQGLDGKGAIYISTVEAARNIHLLKTKNIQAVLSIARGAQISFTKEQMTFYLYIPAQDRTNYRISDHFHLTYNFIESARRQTNILIHCMAGISRSAAVTAAYLMKKFDYSFERVLKHLQHKRPKVNPNSGFIKQLKSFQQQLSLKKTMKWPEQSQKAFQNNRKENEQQFAEDRIFKQSKQIRPLSPLRNKSLVCSSISITRKEKKQIFERPLDREKFVEQKRGSSIGVKINKIKMTLISNKKTILDVPFSQLNQISSKKCSPFLYRNKMKLKTLPTE